MSPTLAPVAETAPEPEAVAFPVPPVLPRAFAFSDLVGSTELAERLGDRRFAALIAEHNLLLRGALAGGGEEAHFLGDGFMVAFPRGEDAIAWAVAAQRAVAGLRTRSGLALALRVGAHAGVAVREGGTWLGRDVIVARRLCEQAGAGEILITRTLRDRVAAPDPAAVRAVQLRGLPEPRAAFRVRWS